MDMDQDESWSAALPPPELTDFLRGIKLQKLDTKLEELGYDDVDDFVEYNAAALQRFCENLHDAGIGPGHGALFIIPPAT